MGDYKIPARWQTYYERGSQTDGMIIRAYGARQSQMIQSSVSNIREDEKAEVRENQRPPSLVKQFHISILLPSIYISLKKNGYYMHEGPLGYWDEKVCNISNPSSTCYKKGLLNPKPVGILHKSLGGVLNAGTTIESRFKKLSKIVSVYVYIYYT